MTEREALEAARRQLTGPASDDPELLAIVSGLVQSASIDVETGCTVAEEESA